MHKTQKGFGAIGILLVIVVFGLVGGAGWYVYRGQDKSADTAVDGSKVTAENKAGDTDATKATYTSKLGGYTISYPKDWVIEGWTGKDNMEKVPAGQLTGTEGAVLLATSNAKSNSFGAWFTLSDNQTNTSSPSNASTQLPFSDGKIVKNLLNGADIWQGNKTYTVHGNVVNDIYPPFETTSDGAFGFKLKNGKYLNVSMSFGYAAGQTTTYSYEEQTGSPELQKMIEVIAGIEQN